ncbi:MAG: TlpA family protein disulfide reductase [Nitrospinae bacterium]|nr:TlpA family protein disulfide reductase [Nitrospinota bacterium]
MKSWSVLVFVVVLMMAGLVANPAGAEIVAGKQAPNFNLQTQNGAAISLDSLKGKITVLNFWATWCPPCTAEMPALERSFNKHKDNGVAFVGVNYQQDRQTVAKFAQNAKITFPLALDEDGKVADAYGLAGIPVTFFIDKNGKVVAYHTGPITEEQLDGWVTRLKGN